ncbi:MAG: response regulator transcription factor [Patescibacteria group bacterium]
MRILVADDDAKLNHLICATLREAGYTPEPVLTACEARECIRGQKYDLALIDWLFDGENIDGCDLIREAKKIKKALPILMLTGRSSLADRIRGLECGADDYLIKPFYLPELVARTRALLRRKRNIRNKAQKLSASSLTVDLDSREVRISGRKVNLPNKEFQLLRILLEHRGGVAARTDLNEKIWGNTIRQPSNTIDVHVRRLRQKLTGFGQEIETVRGIGYRIAVPV